MIRIHSRQFHLIYSNCDFDLEDILSHLEFLLVERDISIEKYLIFKQNNKIQAYIKLDRKFNLHNINFFNITFIDIIYQLIVVAALSYKNLFQISNNYSHITNLE